MRKSILVGSIVALFLMLMMPTLSAVEYNAVEKANEEYYIEYIQNMDIEELKEKVLNTDISEEILGLLDKETAQSSFVKHGFRLICKFLRFVIKIMLLPIKILLLPLKLLMLPFKMLCKIFFFPLKIISCILNIFIPGHHHWYKHKKHHHRN
jgi:hypothetical protein